MIVRETSHYNILIEIIWNVLFVSWIWKEIRLPWIAVNKRYISSVSSGGWMSREIVPCVEQNTRAYKVYR